MKSFKREEGFTLIELLIVIAILGVLAVVVLLALNPVQQLARARDAGRVSGVTQLGHAIEAYATSNNGIYVPEAGTGCTPANWISCLVRAGEIATTPAQIPYSVTVPGSPCASGGGIAAVNGTWCYDATTGAGGAPAIVYARLESQANNSRCTAAVGGTQAYAVYSTADGRGGILCRGANPNAPGTGGFGSGGTNGFLP